MDRSRILRAHRKPDRESVASGSVEQSSGEEVQTDMDKYGTVEQGYNVVCTTYRLTEHYTMDEE